MHLFVGRRARLLSVVCLLVASGALLAAPPSPFTGSTVTVHVRGDAGPLAGAYVALVAHDRPWTRPTSEAMVTNGVAELAAPEGTYELLVSAPNHQSESRTVSVAPEKASSFDVSLIEAASAAGALEDEAGRPVAGARVATIRAVMPPPVGMLSELAFERVAPAETTRTDENGAWRLPVPVDHKMVLLIEAPGYAPVWHTSTPAADQSRLKMTLTRGASLAVQLDRTDADTLVVVRPAAPLANSAIPAEWQARVWARRATAAPVRWDSLPPGDYRIEATWPDPTRFAAPVAIGRVHLAAGDHPTIAAKLPPTPARSASFATFSAPAAADPAGLRAFVKSGGSVREARTAIEPLPNGKLVYVEGAASPADVYLTTPSHLIVPVPRGHAARTADLSSFPRGDARLRIVAPPSVALPASTRVDFRACPNEERPTLTVPIAKDGSVSLPWPSPCRSASLHLEPFAPVALAAYVPRGQSKSLGDVRINVAASAEVHVVHDPGAAPVPHAIVRATVARDPNHAIVVAEQIAGDDGTLVMTTLPPDEEITFEARDAATNLGGIAHARLEAGKRTVVEPVAIPEPASLTLAPTLDPSFLKLYPAAKIRAAALGREDVKESRPSRELSDKQEVTFDGITPGKWRPFFAVDVDDATQMIDIDPVTVRAGDAARVTPVLKPAVFEGRLVSHGHGVEAQILIVDPPAQHSYGRTVRTTADGLFRAVLPGPGLYDVNVVRQIQGQVEQIALGQQRFDDPSQPVQLELPGGGIAVYVRRGKEPVADANVTAIFRKDRSDGGVDQLRRVAKTNAQGRATFEELQEGPWIVQARDEKGHLAEKTVAVAGPEPLDALLAFDAENALAGNVREAAGNGAAEASVQCFYLAADQLPRDGVTKTDLGGAFSLPLPEPEPPLLHCGVTTMDGAVAPFTASPQAGADVALPVATGRLVIEDWTVRLRPNVLWLVGSDGSLVNLTWVAGKIGKVGAPLVIPRLPAGSWSVVRAETLDAWMRIGRGLAGTLPVAAEFRLEPGQTRAIRVNSEITVARR
jgi:hypothetical protein